MTEETVTITLLYGGPINITGPDVWQGWQRALQAKAEWVTFSMSNGDVTVRLSNIVSVLHLKST